MKKPYTITPDKGWAWAVLIACFFSMCLVDGIIHSFGILYLELLDYFKESRSATSWVGSLLPGIQGMSGPFVSALINRFGCRKMTMVGSAIAATGFFVASFANSIWMMSIFYGVFGGFGFSLMYISGFVIISQYFEKRRAFAMGFASCGSGVGTFVFAPLTSKLLETFAWRGGLWIISAIVLNGIVCGALYRPGKIREVSTPEGEKTEDPHTSEGGHHCENGPKEVGDDQEEKEHILEFSLLTKPVFLCFCIATFMVFIGNYIPYIFLPDLARERGVASKELCSFLPSIIGITNTAGRLICGAVSDRPWSDPLKIFSCALVICGLLTMCVALMYSYALLALYAALFGLCIGAYVSLFAVILIELLGLKSLSSALGFVSIFCGLAALSGAPLAGALHDSTGDYKLAFYCAGTSIAAAGFIMFPLRLIQKWKYPCRLKEERNITKNCSQEPFLHKTDPGLAMNNETRSNGSLNETDLKTNTANKMNGPCRQKEEPETLNLQTI